MNASRRLHKRRDWKAQAFRGNLAMLRWARRSRMKPRYFHGPPSGSILGLQIDAFRQAVEAALPQWQQAFKRVGEAVERIAALREPVQTGTLKSSIGPLEVDMGAIIGTSANYASYIEEPPEQ